MPISIKIPGASFPRSFASVYPEPYLLRSLHFLHTSAEEAIINRVNDEIVATVNGTPTFSSTAGTFSGTNYLDLNSGGSTTNMALLSVHKRPVVANSHAYISNWQSGVSGEMLHFDGGGGGTVGANQAGNGATTFTGLVSIVGTDFYAYLVSYDTASIRQFIRHAGIDYSQINSGDRSPLSSADFLVGRASAGSAYTIQPAEHIMCAIWDRSLGAGEAETIFDWVEAYCQELGVTDLSADESP